MVRLLSVVIDWGKPERAMAPLRETVAGHVLLLQSASD